MVSPKKLNTGYPREVVGDQVISAQDRGVEREQLNRIIKRLQQELDDLRTQVANLSPGEGEDGEGGSYDLSVDETNFSLTNIQGNSYYLDIIPGGINTVDLADGSVTGVKIDFSSFDSDDIQEGITNLFFTDERAQDAVGFILSDSANITLSYNDGAPTITADLINTTVTPGSYGSANQVGVITFDSKGRATAASNVAISITSANVTDFTEAAQDAAGAMATNSTFVNLTYDDGANTLTPSLSATGTPDNTKYLRGDNTWATLPTGVNKHVETFGDGASTAFNIVHGLGTRDLTYMVRLTNSPYTEIYVGTVQPTDNNTLHLETLFPPASSEYTITVIG